MPAAKLQYNSLLSKAQCSKAIDEPLQWGDPTELHQWLHAWTKQVGLQVLLCSRVASPYLWHA
jgi:hypothetical protein